MSEQFSRQTDLRLERLITNPAPFRENRTRKTDLETIRAVSSAVDAAQTIILGLILRSAMPAVADAFSVWQALILAGFAAALAIAMRRSLRPAHTSGARRGMMPVFTAATATLLALVVEAGIAWVTLSQSMTPSVSGRTAWFLTWGAAASLGSAGVRYAAGRVAAGRDIGNRLVLVGSPEHVRSVADLVRAEGPASWNLVGHYDDREPDALDALIESIERRHADVVALALSGPDAAPRLRSVCARLADQPVRICLALDPVAFVGIPRAAKGIGRVTLVDILTDPHGGLTGVAKRWMDIVVSLLAFVLLAPLLLVVALAIKLESPGAVIFRQWRFGVGSQPIQVLKFRTMYTDAADVSGAQRTLARDSRVTKVGRILRRTSLDELPQLINVLRGTMSLVGPRPHPLHMRVGEQYYFDVVTNYRTRHIVKPGITGWAQINGSRGEIDTPEKAERRIVLDLWYLENWSLWLDLRIVLSTVWGGFLSLRAD